MYVEIDVDIDRDRDRDRHMDRDVDRDRCRHKYRYRMYVSRQMCTYNYINVQIYRYISIGTNRYSDK